MSSPSNSIRGTLERSPWLMSFWAVAGAFGAYFCMYAFRRPYTAAGFAGGEVFGLSEKSALVTAQVLGYMLAKFIGIRVIAELPQARRAVAIVGLIGAAEATLLLFGLAPAPFHVFCLFLNGLSLGMVFGLVLGFLEGRRFTEALAAGLCTSFILADGVMKSLGAWLLNQGVSERWMPAVAGLSFLPPLLAFAWMLSRVPPPTAADVARRSERTVMTSDDRRSLVRELSWGLVALVAVYLLVTILRSLRADFAPEIWRALGSPAAPADFSTTEFWIACGVLVCNGASVFIGDNRRAFQASLGVSAAGMLLVLTACLGARREWMSDFGFMVMVGLGLYLPYVAMHTTVFERLLALTRQRGNLGFLMYVADSIGYLGYVAVMIGKDLASQTGDFLSFFLATGGIVGGLSLVGLAAAGFHFRDAATPVTSIPIPVEEPVEE